MLSLQNTLIMRIILALATVWFSTGTVSFQYYRDLDAVALECIDVGSKEILSATNEDEILVFIGNSPSYFYHSLKHVRPHVFQLPMSGLYYLDTIDGHIDEMRETQPNGVKKYESVYLDPIRNLARLGNRKVVLIDWSYTGRAMDVFHAFLGIPEAEGLQIISPDSLIKGIFNPLHLHIRKFILSECEGKFANQGYVRLCPGFCSHLWDTSGINLVSEYIESHPNVARNIAMIPPPSDSPLPARDHTGRMVNISDLW